VSRELAEFQWREMGGPKPEHVRERENRALLSERDFAHAALEAYTRDYGPIPAGDEASVRALAGALMQSQGIEASREGAHQLAALVGNVQHATAAGMPVNVSAGLIGGSGDEPSPERSAGAQLRRYQEREFPTGAVPVPEGRPRTTSEALMAFQANLGVTDAYDVRTAEWTPTESPGADARWPAVPVPEVDGTENQPDPAARAYNQAAQRSENLRNQGY
jgi:hypothetical protein